MQNDARTKVSDRHNSGTIRSLDVQATNENPGALAGATGANVVVDLEADYRLRREWAISLRLVIESCDPTDAAMILCDELDKLRAGRPTPPLYNALEEARWWAGDATPYERKAYALAAFEALTQAEQAGFLAHVSGRAAA